ncbi:DUF58 domain-containing protein [Flindersiella endophytica]
MGGFSSLTTRGRAFLAAGIAAALCSLVLGQKDLLRVAIFLIALPVVTVLLVARTRYRIAATRYLHPGRVPVGRPANVQLRLENVGRMPTGPLMLEDHVPYVLGARPRFVLDRMSARWRRDVAYSVRSDVRGRYPIGPLTLRVSDPFGLVELTRSFKGTDALLVTPEVHPLPSGRLTGEWAANGESRPRAVTADGEEDVTVREYRDGDDLRRVHWRSSARRGELMVRREEQPWQSRATVFLDTRKIGHRGSGPASSFEYSVSAAASISTHLLRRGYALRLATDAGAALSVTARDVGPVSDAEGLMLDALAVVGHSSVGRLDHALSTLPNHDGSYGLLIALLGVMSAEEAEAMVRIRHRATAAFAIIIDAPSWALSKERSPEQAAAQVEASVQMMRRGGWRVVTARAGDSIPKIWTQLTLNPGGLGVAGTPPGAPGASDPVPPAGPSPYAPPVPGAFLGGAPQ